MKKRDKQPDSCPLVNSKMPKSSPSYASPAPKPRRILVMASVWPEPDSSAAGQRTLSLIRLFIRQNWPVTVVSAAGDSPYMADLEALGASRISIPLNDSRLDSILKHIDPNWVLFDRFMTEEQFGWRVAKACPRAMRILDTIDLHSLRDARHRAHREGRDLKQEDFQSDLALREIAAVYRSDVSLVVSSAELDILREYYQVPATLTLHCPLMTSLPDPATWKNFELRKHFVHIGNFKHLPNWDAVQWLSHEIWPAIRSLLPHAELHLYGAYESPQAKKLHNPDRGFHMMGRADQAVQTLSQYRVCLAPLRFGAGQKGKLLDAMLSGTPSVTTPVGSEGMQGCGEWPGHVVRGDDNLAEPAARLYRDPTHWKQAQARAFPLLRNQFDEARLAPELLHQLESHDGDLESLRNQNFIGAMLRHHTLRSTEYMARWIEAKNRKIPET